MERKVFVQVGQSVGRVRYLSRDVASFGSKGFGWQIGEGLSRSVVIPEPITVAVDHDGLRCFFAVAPLMAPVPLQQALKQMDLTGQWLYAGYRGWFQDQWFDSPVILGSDDQVVSYLPAGTVLAGELGLATTGLAFDAWQVPSSILNSIVLGMQQRLSQWNRQSVLWLEGEETLATAVKMVGARKAFPSATIGLRQAPICPRVKRLTQNLGFCDTRFTGRLPGVTLNLTGLFPCLTHEQALTEKQSINEASAVIPEGLL